MADRRDTGEREKAAREEAARLIRAHGEGAWDVAVQRAWESGGERQSDHWWRVTRIVERRVGLPFRS